MKYIPGHQFAAKKTVKGLEAGISYRIFHIAPQTEGIKYIFVSPKGHVDITFTNVEEAELVIEKASK